MHQVFHLRLKKQNSRLSKKCDHLIQAQQDSKILQNTPGFAAWESRGKYRQIVASNNEKMQQKIKIISIKKLRQILKQEL